MKYTRRQIVVSCYTPHGSPIIQKEFHQVQQEFYFIKDLQGTVRRACRTFASKTNLVVCLNSVQGEFIPERFHPLGACDADPRILRRIFGTWEIEEKIYPRSKLSSRPKPREKPSRIEIWHDPISIKPTTKPDIQNVFIGKARIKSFAGGNKAKIIPAESVFAGYFKFYIDVTKLTNDEIKFLMDALLHANRLYAGESGHIQVLEVELQQE